MAACEELGLETVAVYSDADRNAGHVEYADEAYNVGPAPASDSYLDQETIVDVAERPVQTRSIPAMASSRRTPSSLVASNRRTGSRGSVRQATPWKRSVKDEGPIRYAGSRRPGRPGDNRAGRRRRRSSRTRRQVRVSDRYQGRGRRRRSRHEDRPQRGRSRGRPRERQARGRGVLRQRLGLRREVPRRAKASRCR